MAAHIVASYSNGISAIQLQAQIGLGSYKTARLLLDKLRRAMVDPERGLLQDVVEIDETEMPLCQRVNLIERDPGERNVATKIKFLGAVELSEEGYARRIRLEPISDKTRPTLHGFIHRAVAPDAHIITDGLISYEDLPNNTHEPGSPPGGRHTKCCTGFIGYSRTSRDGRRACSTVSAVSTSSATSKSSSSGGTAGVIFGPNSTVSSGSASAFGQPPTATSSSTTPEIRAAPLPGSP